MTKIHCLQCDCDTCLNGSDERRPKKVAPCDVKLPVLPEDIGPKTVDRVEFLHFQVTVKPRTVMELCKNPGLPSHDVGSGGALVEIDLCKRCAESITVAALLSAERGRSEAYK